MSSIHVFIFSLLFSVLVTAALLMGRYTIKLRRQRLIEDLQKAYEKRNKGKNLELIPSFEIARYKYDLGTEERDRPRPDRLKYYLAPVLIYVLVCALGLYICISLTGQDGWWSQRNLFLLGISPWENPSAALDWQDYQRKTVVALCFAFGGAYLWSIIYLVRRIAVYDLSPLSFLRVTFHILLACFVCIVMRHIADFAVIDGINFVPAIALVGLAFLIGFHPKLGLDYVIDAIPTAAIKRNHPEARKLSHHLPLDMIDGINAFTKFRLEELEVEDVQTLGTENPILLFVESPYGFYEIFDWIAQAQIIMAVGPKLALELRNIGIRSLYDLETFSADESGCNFLAKHIFGDRFDGPTCRRMIETWGGALHVQRFRQIWNAMLDAMKDIADETVVRRWPPTAVSGTGKQ